MKASFDQSTSDMFKLFSSLHEQVIPRRDFDSNALAGIPGPDVSNLGNANNHEWSGQKVEI
jgi:hypothetical protein